MTNHPIEPHPVLVRLAKAISGQDDAGWAALPADDRERLYGGGKWQDAGRTRADYLDDARAALESLRDLTPDVRKAGEQEMMARHTNLDCFNDPYVDSTWTAMINHILGESA